MTDVMNKADDDPRQYVLGLIFGAVQSKALASMASLGIADLLERQAMDLETLARETGTSETAMLRLLDLLEQMQLLQRDDKGQYRCTEAGLLLKATETGTFHDYALLTNDGMVLEMLGHMQDSLVNGSSVFEVKHGSSFYQALQSRPEFAALLNGAMREISAQDVPETLAVFAPGDAECIIDVGGGEGHLLGAILEKYPGPSGELLDVPKVAASAHDTLAALEASGRCRIHEGDFLEEVPAGGDIYLLKRVLSHLSDEDALQLLKNIRAAMKPAARLLLIDPDTQTLYGASYNLLMLSVVGGQGVRTRDELQMLFEQSGFTYTDSVKLETELCIIEVTPI